MLCLYSLILIYTVQQQLHVSSSVRKELIQDIVGKEDNADNQHFFFSPNVFYSWRTKYSHFENTWTDVRKFVQHHLV